MLERISCGLLVAAVLGSTPADAQESGSENPFDFVEGPTRGELAEYATIEVPEGYLFAGPEGARRFMLATQNIPSGDEVGIVLKKDDDWFMVFEFDAVGYVPDDEKDDLDADELLEALTEATEAGNKLRRKRGWPELHVVGWEREPHYDETTHNLEWATRAESEGSLVVNHNTRLLGRRGVMRVTLVADPEEFGEALPQCRALLAGFSFKPGQTYAEYRKGDKIAKYGLTALVVGGAGAVAVKTGLFKWLWKVIVVAAASVGAFLKRLFSRRRDAQEEALAAGDEA